MGVVLFCFLFLFCFLLLLCPLKKKRRLIRVCKLQINRPTPVPKGKNASISCSDLFTYCTVKQQEAGCTMEIVCQRLRVQQAASTITIGHRRDRWMDRLVDGRTDI